MEQYDGYKICSVCGTTTHYKLNKYEAAFERFTQTEAKNAPCPACGSVVFSETGDTMPEIDKELLDLWGNNENRRFSDQDEEIIIAEEKYIDLFTNAIDKGNYLQVKKDILLATLCILYYDHAAHNEEYSAAANISRKEVAEKVLPELIKRRDQIAKIPDWQLRKYVTEVVYPAIGLKPTQP